MLRVLLYRGVLLLSVLWANLEVGAGSAVERTAGAAALHPPLLLSPEPSAAAGGTALMSRHTLHDLVKGFEDWLKKYAKRYASLEERAHRFEIWVRNKIYVDLHNASPRKTYELGVNQFADLTFDEFYDRHVHGVPANTLHGVSTDAHRGGKSHSDDDPPLPAGSGNATLPAEVDWRTSGCVSAVKNQGACGSCYAFSAVGAVESAYCLKHDKQLTVLSEEQVISCARGWWANGCNGGLMPGVFMWASDTGGLCAAEDVPYVAHPVVCPRCERKVKVTGFVSVPRYSESALKTALALKGPISVAIEADQTAFQFYKSGVMTAPCGDNLDHGVLLVGYGKDADTGIDYWLIKNSWGEDWGEKGYIRIAVPSHQLAGNCGILGMASYPVVVA